MSIHRTTLTLALGLALLAVLAAPRAAAAQEAATTTSESARRETLEPLLWLVGEWEGEGWIQKGPGERSTFTIHERAETALGDRLIVVEGVGRSTGEGEDAGQVVHHAFGVLSWDGEQGDYRFSTYRADDTGVDARATVEDGVVTWGFETPQGQVRFHIRQMEDGAWRENGEFSPDQGTTWYPFFEMTLRRVVGPSTGHDRGAGAGR
jgi:hypothetical protein